MRQMGEYGMKNKEIIDFVEDRNIKTNEDWYMHATKKDIKEIEKIFAEGIKSAYLRGLKGNHFNGKYYISLIKVNSDYNELSLFLKDRPKFVINNISPFYAERKKFKLRRIFINTIIPLRTSEWDGEYQEFLKIDASNIIAIEYSLFKILNNSTEINDNIKENLKFLKEIILCLKKLNINLPIYDFSSNKEINKEKVLSLNI